MEEREKKTDLSEKVNLVQSEADWKVDWNEVK